MPAASDDFEAIARSARAAPRGPTRIALWQEAADLADTRGDGPRAYEARMGLVEATQMFGRADLALVAFSWCLAYADAHPEQGDDYVLHWYYKWMLGSLPGFPDVPKAQIEAMFDDMTRRYLARGSSLHAIHLLRRSVAVSMFDEPAAVAADKRLRRAKRDSMSNCAACVRDAEARWHFYRGRDAKGFAAARELIDSGLACNSVPHRTYARLLAPTLRRGDPATAMRYHKAGYPLVRANPAFLGYQGEHMAFLALTGNRARAATLLSRHLPTAVTHPELDERFNFLTSAKLTLSLLRDAPRPPRVAVPEGIDPAGSVDALVAWVDRELADLAARYDARNGNAGHAEQVAADQAMREYAVAFPYAHATCCPPP